MTMHPNAPAFDTAMRGYERTAVDAKITAVTAERVAFEERAAQLEQEIAALHGAMSRGEPAPGYITVARQMETLLLTAHADAQRIVEATTVTGEREREQANASAEAERVRTSADAERMVAELKVASEAAIAEARRAAAATRTYGHEQAAALASGAGEIVDKARLEGADLATGTEAALAAQREQFELDVVARQETAERRLAETATMAAQMKAEAISITADSQKAAQALIEAAKGAAHELASQTDERAARLKQEAEREVAALTHRRDSINAQLANVRETLASLAGGAAMAAVTNVNGS